MLDCSLRRSLVCRSIHRKQWIRVDCKTYVHCIYLERGSSISVYIVFAWGVKVRYLRHVCLRRVDLLLTSVLCQYFSLRCVHLTYADQNLIRQILFFCPSLHFFLVTFIGQNSHIFSLSSFYENLPREFTFLDSYQKSFFKKLKSSFFYVPDMAYISLQFAHQVPYFRVIDAMVDRLEILQGFDGDILKAPKHQTVSVEGIQKVKPYFQSLAFFEKDHDFRLFLTDRLNFSRVKFHCCSCLFADYE